MTMTTTADKPIARPWYREPWPWFLMSGPVIVIIAALVSAYIAVRSSDGLVTEDYYKQGLAAGETLAKDQHAKELGVVAGLRLTEDRVQVSLRTSQGMAMPSALVVMLSHPTRAGVDQKAVLKPSGSAYVGELNLPASGHWLVLVEDEAKTWRVMGSVMLPAAGEVLIGEAENPAGR